MLVDDRKFTDCLIKSGVLAILVACHAISSFSGAVCGALSAVLDGANHAGRYLVSILPHSLCSLATITLLSVVGR